MRTRFGKFPSCADGMDCDILCASEEKDMNSTFKFAWRYYFGFTAGAARAC